MEIDNTIKYNTTEVILSVLTKKRERKKLITKLLLFKLDNEDFEDYEDDDDEMWENSYECSPGPSSEDCKCVRQAKESLRILEREFSCVGKTSNKLCLLSLPKEKKNCVNFAISYHRTKMIHLSLRRRTTRKNSGKLLRKRCCFFVIILTDFRGLHT